VGPNSHRTNPLVNNLFRDIQQWTVQKAVTFGSETIQMSDDCVSIFSKQAYPCHIGQYAVVAFCGRCKAKYEWENALSFFLAETKTAGFVNFIMRTLATYEQSEKFGDYSEWKILFFFTDLYNWCPRERRDVTTASVSRRLTA